MKCEKCETIAPENLAAIGKVWVCEECACEPVHLFEELHNQYRKLGPGRYVYISELTNNLDKAAQYFMEEVNMDNPFCTVTLVMPEGLNQLSGPYDVVYIDTGCMEEQKVRNQVLIADFGMLRLVNPTTQMVI